MDDPQQLCNACVVAFGRLQKLETPIEHHVSLDALRAAASFCAFCKRIMSHCTRDLTNAKLKTALHLHQNQDYGSDIQMLRALSYRNSVEEVLYERKSLLDIEGNFMLKRVTKTSDRLGIQGYVPEGYTGSDSCLNLARQWLHRCLSEHRTCERPKTATEQKQWRPSRLLLIDPLQSDSPRLVDESHIPPGVRYATLSHRWGHMHSNVCLRKDNLEKFKASLPDLTALPAISQAVDIARRLEFCYLWIDSFCIVQDSVDDWQHECALMSNVYKYSALNISATSAKDGSEGCFWKRDVSMKLPTRLEFSHLGVTPRPHASVGPYDLADKSAPMRGLYDLQEEHTWFFDIGGGLLNRRGWVLQERILAPRVLHFTSSQLYWECNELQASESHPHAFPNEVPGNVTFKRFSPFSLKADLVNAAGVPDHRRLRKQAFQVWANALEAYTGADTNADGEWVENLTMPSDKLVAISAIAKELQPYIGSDYLAGHWRIDLERQLSWRGPIYSWKQTGPYRAPSWSWASVNAIMQQFAELVHHYDCEGFVSLIKILDVQVELAGPDEMGQVKGGFLRIRGHLLEIHVKSLGSYRYQSDGEEVLYCGEKTMLHVQQDDELDGFSVPCQLFCLPLEMIIEQDEICFHAMLLKQIDKNGTYRRVGYLGPNITDQLTLTNVEEDPILRVLGGLDRSDASAVRFERDLTNLVDFTII